jgi:predicted Rossmann-fold nucleotide-binding protein
VANPTEPAEPESGGYRKGPVTLRRTMVPRSTTDQRLLDSRGPSDWVHTDPWRVMRIQSEFVEGFGALAELGPAVSVFGSARTQRDSPDYQLGVELGRRLAQAGFAVITGGGPGAMEAANRGACEAGGVSVGLGIELPFEQGMKYAQGFAVLPGGFGTFDELFEALVLVQTHKVTRFPIVMMGVDYWQGLLDWIAGPVLSRGMIGPADLSLVRLTDDLDEALDVLSAARSAREADWAALDEGVPPDGMSTFGMT